MTEDPLDLEAFRAHGHTLVDWIADYLATLESRPVVEPVAPGEIRARLPAEAPDRPEPFAEWLRDLEQIVVPGMAHWQHPGWFAYFPAMTSPAGILGELAAAGLGGQGMLWSTAPAATEIESHVLDWFVDLMDVPQAWKSTGPGGGVIQMSASDSTHVALVVAREVCRDRTGARAEDMVVYASSQAHSGVEKGVNVAGIGHLRLLDVDAELAAIPAALEQAVGDDLAAGLVPAFVCATVGTTGTTAVDPVRGLGEIATAHELWFHVDAAYAGAAMICPEFRHHQDGLELVDSYTWNPHKWLATNFDCSIFWVADRRPLIDALSIVPPYLRPGVSESTEAVDYRDWHVPLGRRFRALKLWWVLRSFGVGGLQARIRSDVARAHRLTDWIDAHPQLESIAPTVFGLVTFAHVDGNAPTEALVEAINSAGDFYVLPSSVGGRTFVRVSIGSTWTEDRHVDALRDRIATALA